MKVKTLFFVLIVCISYSILVNGETTTTGLFSDSDSLSSGYFVSYTRTISHSSTTVEVTVSSSGHVDVAICGGGEFEDWNDGGSEPDFEIYRSDTTSTTITLILGVGSYDFAIMNYGYSTVSYTIVAIQSYEVTGGNGGETDLEVEDYVYGLIGLGVIAIIIVSIVLGRRRRRRQMPTAPVYYHPQQPYQTYQPQQPYQPYQATEQPSPDFELSPKGFQVCSNCGYKEDIDAKYCTSCGGKLT